MGFFRHNSVFHIFLSRHHYFCNFTTQEQVRYFWTELTQLLWHIYCAVTQALQWLLPSFNICSCPVAIMFLLLIAFIKYCCDSYFGPNITQSLDRNDKKTPLIPCWHTLISSLTGLFLKKSSIQTLLFISVHILMQWLPHSFHTF